MMCTHLFGLSTLWASVITAVLLIIFLIPAIITKNTMGIAANFNLLTTMLLGGFWHGASWNFIIWGAIHGIGLGIHKIWMLITGKRLAFMNKSTAYKIVMGIFTFHFVCFGWVFFKAEDFETAMTMLHQIAYNFDWTLFKPFYDNYYAVVWMIVIAGALHLIPDNLADRVIAKMGGIPLVAYIVAFFVFLLVYGMFKSSEQVMPIYLQF